MAMIQDGSLKPHPFRLPLDNRRLATIINQTQIKMRFQNTGISGERSLGAERKLAEMLAKPAGTTNAKALAIQDKKSDVSEPNAVLAIKDLNQDDPVESMSDAADPRGRLRRSTRAGETHGWRR